MTKKILVVDDEPSIVKMLEARLKGWGYEVLTAIEGTTGLEKARKDKPDLIILDLMLPGMDGYQICALLKKDSRYSKIPIILFTARAQQTDITLGEEAGADAYVTKPFEPQVLLGKIKELLSSHIDQVTP